MGIAGPGRCWSWRFWTDAPPANCSWRVVAGELWLASCGWRAVAGELWLAGYFKGCLVGGSVREVCAGGEDILLSERDKRGKSRVNNYILYKKRSKYK